jgi:type II secretion system protein L
MACSVGIDITADGIRLVQLSRRRGKLSVLGAYARDVQPRESSGPSVEAEAQILVSLLIEMIREVKPKANATVVVGLPCEKVFFCSLRTELTKLEDVRRLLKFELEDDFPLPFDELVADICSGRRVGDDKYEYLIAAASRSQINTWAQALTETGRQRSVLSTDTCALHALAHLVQPHDDGRPSMLLYADGRRAILDLVQDGLVTCARHLPCMGNAEAVAATLAREVELTVRGTLGRQCQLPLRILLSGPDELVRELSPKLSQATGHEVVSCPLPTGDNLTTGNGEPTTAPDGRHAIAVGLALIGLGSRGNEVNFLKADLSQTDRMAKSRMKRSALVSAVLVAMVLALLGLRTFGQVRALGDERIQLTRQIRAVFTKTLPSEKKVVNELAQMTEHLNSLRKEHDTLAAIVGKRIQPLRVLHILSEKLTSEKGIGVSSLSMKDKTVRVTGTGSSFESVEQFLSELRQVPEFGSVELEDVALSRGRDRPEFRIVILLKAG